MRSSRSSTGVRQAGPLKLARAGGAFHGGPETRDDGDASTRPLAGSAHENDNKSQDFRALQATAVAYAKAKDIKETKETNRTMLSGIRQQLLASRRLNKSAQQRRQLARQPERHRSPVPSAGRPPASKEPSIE
jgi:hypothetical protein